MKDKKLIAAVKSFKENRNPEKAITFEEVLEFNRIHAPELYRDYMKAVAELEKSMEKKNEEK